MPKLRVHLHRRHPPVQHHLPNHRRPTQDHQITIQREGPHPTLPMTAAAVFHNHRCHIPGIIWRFVNKGLPCRIVQGATRQGQCGFLAGFDGVSGFANFSGFAGLATHYLRQHRRQVRPRRAAIMHRQPPGIQHQSLPRLSQPQCHRHQFTLILQQRKIEPRHARLFQWICAVCAIRCICSGCPTRSVCPSPPRLLCPRINQQKIHPPGPAPITLFFR